MAPAVRTGRASNHLMLTRRGATVAAYANGVQLIETSDPDLAGEGWQGVIVQAWSANAEGRFDNFRLYDLAP